MNSCLSLVLFVSVFLGSLGASEEFTVELGEFRQEVVVEVTAIPTEIHGFRLEPQSWEKFQVEWVAEHGAKVKKGDNVVLFDRKPYEEALKEAESKLSLQALELKTLGAELKFSDEKGSRELAAIDLALQRAQQDHDYFFRIKKPEAAREARWKFQKSEQHLSYQKEEYEQLLKMYQEDELTEETEEIILVRAKNRIQDHERKVEQAKLNMERALTIQLERDSQDQLRPLDRRRDWVASGGGGWRNNPLSLSIVCCRSPDRA